MICPYQSNLEDEIRLIISSVQGNPRSGQLTCSANGDGMSSGIPGAFADALDRHHDIVPHTNERFHFLIAELLYIVRRGSNKTCQEVTITVNESEIDFCYENQSN